MQGRRTALVDTDTQGINLMQISRSTNFHGVEYPSHMDSSLYVKTCGIQRCIPGYSYLHSPKEGYHLHVVLSGRGVLRVRDRVHDVHEGQIFLLRENEEIYYEADTQNPWHYVWVAFAGEHANRYMHYAGFTEGIYVQECHVPPMEFYTLVKEILEHPHLNISSELHRMSLALQYLSLAIESREFGQDGTRQREDLSPDDYVAYAARYIQANYANIRISDVASYIGINRTYLTTLFKKKMLMSPQEFLMHVRMDRSRSLLRHTDIPVSAVAKEVGYDDQLAFSKIFKKKFGLSPAQFRKKVRGESAAGERIKR
jgi:AraC family transcriptional regulator of arabinose operon